MLITYKLINRSYEGFFSIFVLSGTPEQVTIDLRIRNTSC